MADKKLVTVFGETKTLVDWSDDKRCSVCANTLSCRLNRGWDVERAVMEPSQHNGADFDFSKLGEKDIPEIFRLREDDMWSFKELSIKFGVTEADIGYVLHRDIWEWVPVDHEYTGGRIWISKKDGTRRKVYGSNSDKYPNPNSQRS